MAVNARSRLLDAAERLFYAEGIRAVGIERVISEASIGKASFYRHFASKDELVVAVLRSRDERWRAWLAAVVDASNLPDREKPLALFDGLRERFSAVDFRGCAFINTMVESADADSAAHRTAVEHKEKVVHYLDGLLANAGYVDHDALARCLSQLADGAIVTAVRERTPAPADRGRAMAAALLSSAPHLPAVSRALGATPAHKPARTAARAAHRPRRSG